MKNCNWNGSLFAAPRTMGYRGSMEEIIEQAIADAKHWKLPVVQQ